MAYRHLKDYYEKIQSQYMEMLGDAKDYQQGVDEGSLTPEQAEQAYAMTAKLKENYERITYILYLLEMPNRKSKEKTYERQNRKALRYLSDEKADEESAVSEGGDALKEFRSFIKGLRESKGDGNNG